MKLIKQSEKKERLGDYVCITTNYHLEESKSIIKIVLLPIIKLLNKILTHVNSWLEKKALNGR